ncbi:MAG: hypothetical protein ACRCZF_11515, partial [Gemmataceae bacterium]
DWMLLHVQLDPEQGWLSPQVVPEALVQSYRARRENFLTFENVTPARRALLEQLAEHLPADQVLAQLAVLKAAESNVEFVVPLAILDPSVEARPQNQGNLRLINRYATPAEDAILNQIEEKQESVRKQKPGSPPEPLKDIALQSRGALVGGFGVAPLKPTILTDVPEKVLREQGEVRLQQAEGNLGDTNEAQSYSQREALRQKVLQSNSGKPAGVQSDNGVIVNFDKPDMDRMQQQSQAAPNSPTAKQELPQIKSKSDGPGTVPDLELLQKKLDEQVEVANRPTEPSGIVGGPPSSTGPPGNAPSGPGGTAGLQGMKPDPKKQSPLDRSKGRHEPLQETP